MRFALLGIFALLIITFLAWTSIGQDPGPRPKTPGEKLPAPPPSSPPKASERDIAKLSVGQRHLYLSAQRGVDWLQRANRTDGRFIYGYVPSLRAPMEGDDYLHQIGAAFALARAARFFHDDKAQAIATQALLGLKDETTADPTDPQVRYPSLPPTLVNRVSAAGMLVMAIHELPQPAKDLLDPAEQLCHYLRKQQRPDGSLQWTESEGARDKSQGGGLHAGPALHALMRSHQQRPAPWKIEAVRKACTFYHAGWRAQKNLESVPRLTAAYTEAFLQSKDQGFATAVFEMNDWLCTLQFQQHDPRRPLWVGGFMGWADGKPVSTAPQVSSAAAAESLVEACRVARQAADVPRYQRYSQALEKCLQFLTTLQYTEANTQHFADWFRPVLMGAFHRSHQDGDLRLDDTQHAVSALVQYLQHVAELP